MGNTEARKMLDTFASVGAARFDVTQTTAAGDKDWFRRGVSLAGLAHSPADQTAKNTDGLRPLRLAPHPALLVA